MVSPSATATLGSPPAAPWHPPPCTADAHRHMPCVQDIPQVPVAQLLAVVPHLPHGPVTHHQAQQHADCQSTAGAPAVRAALMPDTHPRPGLPHGCCTISTHPAALARPERTARRMGSLYTRRGACEKKGCVSMQSSCHAARKGFAAFKRCMLWVPQGLRCRQCFRPGPRCCRGAAAFVVVRGRSGACAPPGGHEIRAVGAGAAGRRARAAPRRRAARALVVSQWRGPRCGEGAGRVGRLRRRPRRGSNSEAPLRGAGG